MSFMYSELAVGREALVRPDRCSDSSVHLSLCVLSFSSATDSSECTAQVSGLDTWSLLLENLGSVLKCGISAY